MLGISVSTFHELVPGHRQFAHFKQMLLWDRTNFLNYMGGSPYDVSEEPVTYEKRKKG